MGHEILYLRQGVLFQHAACLLLGGEKLVIAGPALLDALDVSGELVRRLHDIPVLRLRQQGLKGRAQLRRQGGQQLLAGDLFHLLVSIFDLRVIIFDGRGQIPGENLRNTLFIALSAAAVTKLLRVPSRSSLSEKEHRKLHRVVRTIAVITVIPSIILGAVTVYSSVVDSNISKFLSQELVFADTQVVQSNTDKMERKISVSLVGMPVSDEKIAQLQERLADYGLEDYSLHVVQNRSLEGETDTDKLTIAVQESTINQMQEVLRQQEERILELEAQGTAGTDWAQLASDAAEIFPWLGNCACGPMSDGAGEYALLTAEAARAVTAEEQQTLEAWLRTASGLDRAVVLLG